MTADEREKLKLQLMRHEGVRLKPYQDTVRKWTIGVGRNLSDRGISYDEALFLLDNDIDFAIRDCLTFPWFIELDSVRQRVLVDMCFNLGVRKLRSFVRTLRAVREGRYVDAAEGMLASKWATQVKGRAVRLAGMMRTGRDYIT